MSTVEELRAQLAETNIKKLAELKISIQKKIEEVKESDLEEKRKPLEEKIADLEAVDRSNLTVASAVDEKLELYNRELKLLDEDRLLESLANTTQLVERRTAELQILGC